MAEVLFYHLTLSPLEAALPDLLHKSRGRGWKVLVRGGDADRLCWLDDRLWATGDADFLPHGLAGGPHDEAQPILLTTRADNPNAADILFAVDQAEVSSDEADIFARVCLMFDGNDPVALDHARQQWRVLTEAGLPAKYWSQESGSWQQKASKNC
jgi:DNA polymerase-3 subunit chi